MRLLFCVFCLCFAVIANSQSRLFWTEFEPSSVKQIDLDDVEVTTILRDIVNRPSSITVDRIGGYIYYGNAESNTINRCNLDGTDVVTLITNTNNVQVIRIDHTSNKLYYGDVSVARLLRADLDGSNEETLFQSNFGVGVYGLELDVDNDRMFFSTGDNIYVSDLDAENPEIIVPDLKSGKSISLDRANDKLYFMDRGSFSISSTISKCDLDGNNVEILDTGEIDESTSLAIDYANGIMYWADEDTKSIMSANIEGGNVQTVLELETIFFSFNYALEYDPVDRRLYWADTSIPAIQWINTETNERGILLSDQINEPDEIVIDNVNKKLYRTDGIFGIYRSELDGSNPEKVIESGSSSRIDITSEHLYYFSSSKDGIMRTFKDGTDEEKVVNIGNGEYVRDLKVDEENGVIIYLDTNIDQIFKTNLEGGDKEALTISSTAWSLALNPSLQKIYYTSRSSGSSASNTITSMDYNGDNKEVIANGEGSYMGWITIDTMSQKLYWTEGEGDGGVYEMNTDGTNKILIQELENEGRGIAFFNDNITSIATIEEVSLSLYPTPASQYIKIDSEVAFSGLSLTSIDGNLISKTSFSEGVFSFQLDLESLTTGQYIIILDFANGNKKSNLIQVVK